MQLRHESRRRRHKEIKMFLFIFLAATSCCSVVMCRDVSDEKVPKLRDLLESARTGKQFQLLEQHDGKSGASVSETNIAMSLVDALQKWADALEAQISMMRDEVAVLKTSNNHLTDKVSSLEMDNVKLSDEVGHLNKKVDDLSGSLRSNVSHLDQMASEMKAGMFKMESQIMMTEMTSSANTNATLAIQNRVRKLEENVADVQGEVRQDLVSVGLAMANTTSFLTKRIDEVSTFSGLIKEDVHHMSNQTHFIDEKLQRFIYSYNHTSGIMEVNIQKMSQESTVIKAEVDSLKFTLTSVKSETSGVSVFVTSMQNHLNELTSNMSSMAQNVSTAMNEIEGMKDHLATVDTSIGTLSTNMSHAVSSLGSNTDQIESIKGNMTTIKTNLVGLGNYINNINGDLSQLLISFDGYAKKMGTEMSFIKGNMSEMSTDMSGTKKFNIELKKQVETVEFMATSVRNDVTGLTTKIYNIKTSLFEQTNDISAVKVSQEQIKSSFDKMETRLSESTQFEKIMHKHVDEMKTDVNNIRTGLTGLTNTVFTIKSKVELSGSFDATLVDLMSNISSVRTELSYVNTDLSTLKPEVVSLTTDVGSFRETINRMGKRSFDPDRFSCAVTSDEIRTPGVITYSVCNVNSNDMMNPSTGHITVLNSGDYFISFTANMVSVKSQAIWCALYKQSPGKDGWEVLGMINNYQRDAGQEDDRDSGSLSLITPLDEGDQVWVEWRGYGESFLYSNPYRLISFTGFLINQSASR